METGLEFFNGNLPANQKCQLPERGGTSGSIWNEKLTNSKIV